MPKQQQKCWSQQHNVVTLVKYAAVVHIHIVLCLTHFVLSTVQASPAHCRLGVGWLIDSVIASAFSFHSETSADRWLKRSTFELNTLATELLCGNCNGLHCTAFSIIMQYADSLHLIAPAVRWYRRPSSVKHPFRDVIRPFWWHVC